MIKLTYLIRKRPDLSEERFAEHWRKHSERFAAAAGSLGARRYAMNLKCETVCNTCIRTARGLAPPDYDGLLEIWWDSLEDYQSGVGSPPGLAVMDEIIDAERRFVDFSRSTAFFADEKIVFDRGELSASIPETDNSKVSLSDKTSQSPIIN